MHYVREMQAFYERLESTPLSVYAIALWHTLMHMKHKRDWNKEFKAALAALCFKSGLKENVLAEAREELVHKGLLNYEDTDEGQAATYTLHSLTEPADELDTNTGNSEAGSIGKTNKTLEIENIGDQGNIGEVENIEDIDITETIPIIKNAGSTVRTSADQRLNSEHTLQANLKKLDIHDKMLKNEWQKSVSIALTDISVENDTLHGLQKYRPGDPVSIVVQPRLFSQAEVSQQDQQKADLTKNRPSAKRANTNRMNPNSVIQPRKKQAKRKAHSLVGDQSAEISSMGPFETPYLGKEKVLQTFTF